MVSFLQKLDTDVIIQKYAELHRLRLTLHTHWVFAQRVCRTTVQTVQISFYNTWEPLIRQGT